MKSQNDIVLKYLKRHPLTQLKALEKFGILRLASRINDLRRAGHNIITEQITVFNRYGKPCRVAKYRLVGE